MGKFNSSTTRVAPVFSKLYADDTTGASWLPTLLNVGTREQSIPASSQRPSLVPKHGEKWGEHEMALPAPLGLLEHLIQSVTLAQVKASGDQGDVLKQRLLLAARDRRTVNDALAELRSGSRGRHWYVLEGASRPDATLEMKDAVLVVEGKRTERSCTSKTKWMGTRSQLLRHMDAATDFYDGKRILGLLIVEGDGGANGLTPSEHWKREASAQLTPAMLEASLPHRSVAERRTIAEGVLGVTTWQYVCAAHGLSWPPVKDLP